MAPPILIGLDWGTTSCRAYLIGEDRVLARNLDGPGILRVENGAFATAFDAMIGPWIAAHGTLPVVLSGMICSRQGWVEAPYARCPATTDDIVRALARIDHAGRTLALVPGLSTENDGMPDVMRGEETQILGALTLRGDFETTAVEFAPSPPGFAGGVGRGEGGTASLAKSSISASSLSPLTPDPSPPQSRGRGEAEALAVSKHSRTGADDGLFLLPGTHSKWAEFRAGRIVSFRTFMTGEVFATLKDHTILGRMMREGPSDAASFERGVTEAAALGGAGSLLNRIFATRTYRLFDRLADTALADYLSGLLVGAEIVEATKNNRTAVTIIANPALAERYAEALRLLGHDSVLAPEDCVAAGHRRLARAAGLC